MSCIYSAGDRKLLKKDDWGIRHLVRKEGPVNQKNGRKFLSNWTLNKKVVMTV